MMLSGDEKAGAAPETALGAHYAFGKNWKRFAADLDAARISHAVRELARLIPPIDVAGKTFLDVGSGSGLSALAALRLGAMRVEAVDLDPDSVATSRAVLGRFAPGTAWRVQEGSALELDPAVLGRFDIVYSWGVLHHTGAMWRAIGACLPLVAEGGLLVLALYRKTPICGFWRWEKRLYSRAPQILRAMIAALYKTAYVAGLLATGRNPGAYIRAYVSNRGMSWRTDVEDWLGGYPYESVSPDELCAALGERGFEAVRSFTKPARLGGFLGTHCDEYVFRKSGVAS